MLYLVDKPKADLAWRTVAGDDDARVVLIQDGVLLEPDLNADHDADGETGRGVPIHAVAKDADARGVDLPPGIEKISYDRVVEMVVDQEVTSFV